MTINLDNARYKEIAEGLFLRRFPSKREWFLSTWEALLHGNPAHTQAAWLKGSETGFADGTQESLFMAMGRLVHGLQFVMERILDTTEPNTPDALFDQAKDIYGIRPDEIAEIARHLTGADSLVADAPVRRARSRKPLTAGQIKKRDQRHPIISEFKKLGFVTYNRDMIQLLDRIKRYAQVDDTVFLCGETGTGKEVMANAIHSLSKRKDKEFVAVNCAALGDSLLQSTLFGHEKGAFTGATQSHIGYFQVAKGGTLFLDEIQCASPAVQGSLLRVLEEGEMRVVGGTTVIKVDVRVIAASNDPKLIHADHKFRSDLRYRLMQLPLDLPPLRARREDIPVIAQHLLKQTRPDSTFSDEALQCLMNQDWPGNVRELRNLVSRVAALKSSDEISETDVLRELGLLPLTEAQERYASRLADLRLRVLDVPDYANLTIAALYIQLGGEPELHMSRQTFYRRMEEIDLE